MSELTSPARSTFPSRLVRVLAICGSLLTAPVDARHGDLDPSFGNVGRLVPVAPVPGQAWSFVALEDGSLVLAGGEVLKSCPSDIIGCAPPRYVGFAARSFLIRIFEDGRLDESFQMAEIEDFHLLAIARQPDGKFVAAGRRLDKRSLDSEFVVCRLNPDGSIDTDFGDDGFVRLPAAERGEGDQATAVLAEPDGRIVVAGSRFLQSEDSPILMRLLADGAIDQTFGSSGITVLPGIEWSGRMVPDLAPTLTRVLRTETGSYRVAAPMTCKIFGVNGNGTLDTSFGTAGEQRVHYDAYCMMGMVAQSDGRLVVSAATYYEGGVLTRLLPDGQPDPSFAEQGRCHYCGPFVGALEAGPDDSIVYGVWELWGNGSIAVRRLLPGGEPDTSFGDAGSTEINMPSKFGSGALLRDLLVRDDGAVVAIGGDAWRQPDRPIVVRLLGRGGRDFPGVLGITRQYWQSVNEEAGDVVVDIGRSGGDAGPVSIAYQVVQHDVPNAATAGDDFVVDAGRLEWEDGDTTGRQVRIRIIDDAAPEVPEQFSLLLTDTDGGAGLGKRGQIIEIAANDEPPGEIGFESTSTSAYEGEQFEVWVTRTGGSGGVVSVKFEVEHDTTNHEDFRYFPSDGTLTWADGDSERKLIGFIVEDDQLAENMESFRFVLAEPSGGATIAAGRETVTVNIAASDSAGGGGGGGGGDGSSGGGGADGFLTLILLATLLICSAKKCGSAAMRDSVNRNGRSVSIKISAPARASGFSLAPRSCPVFRECLLPAR